MSLLAPAFDLLLCTGLLWLAWRALTASALFPGVVMFMVFGLLMAVIWARLGAPDIALAEAAIGAGLTGALLLNACKALLTDLPVAATVDGELGTTTPSPLLRPLAAGLCTLLGLGLAALMVVLAGAAPPVAEVQAAVEAHLLTNPVTVVLLDLRAYDTLLEMAVLLAAFLGATALVGQCELPPLHPPRATAPPMVDPLVAMATPVLIVTAIYLYWSGSHGAGGAFQAGALLGALGVLYRLTGRLEALADTPFALRLAVILGLTVFSAFAGLGLYWADAPLAFPHRGTYPLVLLIELSLMVSIAATLTLLFSASPGLRIGRPR